MPFAQSHVAHRFRTNEGDRWVVLHKPDPKEVTEWESFARANSDTGVKGTTETKRQEAIRGALKGFLNATELFDPQKSDYEHYLLFAFVGQSDPWMRSLSDVFSSVEMYMTITGAITCPVLTHMGITRVFACRNPSKRLAVRFHALTAWAMTRGTLRDRAVKPKYMITAPLQFMGDELIKVGGEPLQVTKTGPGWGQTTTATLPDRTIIKASPRELPWLNKLAFTHDKPMVIAYDTLIGMADPLGQ